MNTPADPSLKTRLTDPTAMVAQVKALLQKGIQLDEIAPELSKLYYVDIDLLNAVLRSARKSRPLEASSEQRSDDFQSGKQGRAAA